MLTAKVKGTGRKGRILREDVQAYVKDAVKRAESAPAAAAGGGIPGMLPWPKVDFSKFGEVEEVELGRIQKISGANLSRNWVMIRTLPTSTKPISPIWKRSASSRMPKLRSANWT